VTKYVIRGSDGGDYELRADHFEVLTSGALIFEDEDDLLVMAYSPSFWQFLSVVDE
jgi:hypothetical protein